MIKTKVTRPPFKCHGGKYFLNQYIIEHMPEGHEKLDYLEAFSGAASVLINKPISEQKEILNDLDPRVVAIMKTLRDEPEVFIKKIKNTTYSERVFERELSKKDDKYENDFDLAFNEFVLRRMSRGGLRKSFAWSNRERGGQPGDVNAWKTIPKELVKISDRLNKVFIFNKNATEVIDAFNYEGVLCYCLHPKSKVKLENEQFKNIEDIQEGDMLHGGRSVLKKMNRIYNDFLFSFKIQGIKDDLQTTKEHKIVAIKGLNSKQETRSNESLWDSREFIKAEDLKVGDYVLVPTGGIEKSFDFKLEPEWVNSKTKVHPTLNICPELFRFIGYYAAEGHLQKNDNDVNSVILSFCKDELNTWVADAMNCIKIAFNVDAKVRKGPVDSVVQVKIYSTVVAKFVEKYVKGLAVNKYFDENILLLPVSQQLEIIKGWIRGDGGLELTSRNRVKLNGTTASPKLAEQLYSMALRCGLKPSSKYRGVKKANDIYFAAEDAVSLGFNVPCKKFRSTRKIINSNILTRIRKINKIPYDGIVYDLDVDQDDLFNVNNVLIHNCDPPYVPDTRTSPNAYECELDTDGHIALATSLNKFKGKVILSGYQSTLYKRLYANWRCVKKTIANHSSQSKEKSIKVECLWLNY
jgi:site-specific DNA-adenine methylase